MSLFLTPSHVCRRWMNGQHLRALAVEELVPMVGSTLVEAGVCKDAGGAFVRSAASLLQGSLELVTDAISQTQDMLEYKVKTDRYPLNEAEEAICTFPFSRIPSTR